MNVLDDHDLRSELDAMFRRRETDVQPMFPLPATAKVRGRTRRVVTTFASAIMIVGIVGLSFAVLSSLVGPRRVAVPASSLDGATLLTSGVSGGMPWTLSAGFIDGVHCTEVEMGGEVSGGCWPGISDSYASAQLEAGVSTLGQDGTPSWRRFTFVIAIVPNDVARVVVRSDAGVARSPDPTEAPQEWGMVDVAVVPIEETTSSHLVSGPVQVQYLDGDGGSAYPDELIQLLENPDVATSPTVPDYVSHRISSIGDGEDARTLFAWKEEGTSKFATWLRSSEKVLGMGATVEFVGDEPFLSIHRRCGRPAGVVWGTVPSNVAAIEVGLVDPDRIETIAGADQLGDVRFVLGDFTEPYAEGASVTYLDTAGDPIDTDWPSATEPCLR
jgi:hypothetical protein